MKFNKILLVVSAIACLLFSALFATAGFTHPGLTQTPQHGTVLTGLVANFNVSVNNTNNGEGVFNLTIYNGSSSAGPFKYLGSVNLVNGTNSNFNFTMKDGTRTYWRYNITNATGGPFVSQVRVFNTDANYNRIVIGSATLNVNFTMFHGSQRLSCGPIHDGTGINSHLNFNCTTY